MARPVVAGLLCALIALPSLAGEERRNWFDDPFFPITSAVAHCPEPLGPRVTEAERRVEAHSRAERGTTCWLAGKCSKPNAYLYDRDIAEAIRARVAADHPFADSSLWVTVQRRFVFVEGCVAQPSDEQALTAYMQAVPDVDRVLVNVYTDPWQKPPYPTVGGT